MEQLLVAVLVLAILYWLFGGLIKSIYRKIFFKKLTAKHTTESLSGKAQALSLALQNNDGKEFYHLADESSIEDLSEAIRSKDVLDLHSAHQLYSNYAQDRPSSAAAQYANGFGGIQQAWAARGTGTADTVTDAGFRGFVSHLENAEVALQNSIALDANSPRPYASLLTVARGKGSNANPLFEDAQRKFPTDFMLHLQMLGNLSERWSGVFGNTLAFARKRSSEDTTNRLQWLIPAAHLDIAMFETDEGISNYFKNKEVRAEIQSAFKTYLTLDTNDQDYLEGMHFFAAAFFSALDKKHAKKAFKKLKGHYSPRAWTNWTDPNELFMRAKWWAS